MIGNKSDSQVASWYHKQILRIPHGDQNPTKRYLNDDHVLELFDGTVAVQEKVDGKMAFDNQGDYLIIYEDMTGKHTVHNHVMQYKDLPVDKMITLDIVKAEAESGLKILPYVSNSELNYAVLMLHKPNIFHINQILMALSHSSSHFGSHVIEGLVVKNYDKGLFGKWINAEFDEMLRGQYDK